jgi:lysyl-tRNA synthetase class 2
LDLIVNEQARETFKIRSSLISTFRRVLDDKGYLEVETPVLSHMAGGAAARPFITFHNTLKKDFFLRIATELHLKRLIVGGLEKVYEIGRIFRNEGVSQRHNPEFTTIELYEAYSDYEGMMELAEELITQACIQSHGTEKIEYQGKTLDFTRPWKRMGYFEALEVIGGVSRQTLYDHEAVKELCKKHMVEVDLDLPLAKLWDELFDTLVQSKLVQPTFIKDYPVELSPLARKIDSDPTLTYRFEAFVANMEVANAFTELNDPIDQLARFEQQQKDREKGDDEAHGMDLDYVEALEYGLPPTGGMGIGIDRVAMVLSNNNSIREVILFPHLRTK